MRLGAGLAPSSFYRKLASCARQHMREKHVSPGGYAVIGTYPGWAATRSSHTPIAG